MADNEEESNKTDCTALGELGAPVPAPEQKSPASVSARSESNHVDADAGEQTTNSSDRDPSQAEAAPLQPSADAKEVIGPEVIGQILGGEIITSFVQTTDNRESSEVAECATVSGDFLTALGPTTTIIYVQPDGSFVESSGLTAEEQQHLLEQLSKQQLVQVTNNDAARSPEQNEQSKPPHPTKPTAISSIDVQQVIDHVNKSQVRSQSSVSQIVQKPVTTQPASYITLEAGNVLSPPLTATIQSQPFTIVQNASQQLQSVAKHVAQQSHSGGLSDQSKQAEPIQFQVQAPPKPEVSQRQAAPITILQPQSLPVSQSVVKVSNVGTVSTPQIIHITPVTGQQQYFLQNPGEPPIQLLLQKPAPVVGSISVPILQKVQAPVTSVSFATGTKSPATKPGAVSIPSTVILTPSSSSSSTTKVLTPSNKTTTVVTKMLTLASVKEKNTLKERQKKPQKIKTRSGRVSRPPKHKVKDYKFIKNEDLAESHQSDSDDYSEISVEEEECEEGKKKDEVDGFSLRNKAFKCEVCEKSYIGLAGLNRHYKLNSSHDKSQTSIAVDEEDSKLTEKEVVSDVPKANPVTEATTQKVQADSTRQIERRRPGRPKGSGRSNLPKRLGRKAKRGRRGRPPKHQTTLTLEQQEERRRNRLTQLIEQYDDEDLMEIVLPRLAKVMTVWEFLLIKVENSFSSKQQFPSVYHEFEQLHSQVKKMADEHFSIAPASRPAVNINNLEVLKSLGITDPSSALALDLSQGQLVTSRSNQATKSLRSFENTKMLPPAKRFKMENCGKDKLSSEANHNGIQKHDEDSVLLREPQVLLTRLEELPDTDGMHETRTEDEPMDSGACSLETEAAKSQGDSDFSEVLNSGNVDITNQVKELEDALSSDAKCEVLIRKIDENCESPQLSSLEETEAIEEPATCQVVIHSDQAEDEPQVFIQTAEGLVRQSAEELAAKGIVIVNGPDGSTVHIEAPEGVPLDTVHALLGIETEKKT